MELRWIGGPVLLIGTTAYGLWFNRDLTPWREFKDDSGVWFGRRRWIEVKEDGDRFERTAIYLWLIALIRNQLLEG